MTLTARIDPDRLNTIRRARKLGRPRLAKLSGLTERHIARLEGAVHAHGEPEVEVLTRLAAALQVAPAVLSGDMPLTEGDLCQIVGAQSCRSGCCG